MSLMGLDARLLGAPARFARQPGVRSLKLGCRTRCGASYEPFRLADTPPAFLRNLIRKAERVP